MEQEQAQTSSSIYITNAEMAMGLKSLPTACMQVDSKVLEPTQCFSKSGISSRSMFGQTHAGHRPKGQLSLDDYASLFMKYYGPESIVDKMVTKSRVEQKPSTASSGRPQTALAVRGSHPDSTSQRPSSAGPSYTAGAVGSADACSRGFLASIAAAERAGLIASPDDDEHPTVGPSPSQQQAAPQHRQQQGDLLAPPPPFLRPDQAPSQSEAGADAEAAALAGERQVASRAGGAEAPTGTVEGTTAGAGAHASDRTLPPSHQERVSQVAAAAEAAAAAAAAAVDADIAQRAARELRANTLTPKVAHKYGLSVGGAPPRPPLNPALHGVALLHAGSGIPRELVPTTHDAHCAVRVVELAASMEDVGRSRQRTVREAQVRAAEARAKATRALATEASGSTSSFKAPTRDQRARYGSHFVEPPANLNVNPAVGKYDPKFTQQDKHQPSAVVVHSAIRDNVLASLKTKADEAARKQREHVRVQSAPAATAPARRDGEEEELHAMRNSQGPHGMAMFSGAHRVHDGKAQPKGGSSSFKAPSRPSPSMKTTAGHLFNSYYHDGIDKAVKRQQPVLANFEKHTERRPPTSRAGANQGWPSSPALGPGAYFGTMDAPTDRQGRNVHANHTKHANHAIFSRTAARPGSAPPPNAASVQIAASARNRPASAAVPPEEAAHALTSMFEDALNPSDLVAVSSLARIHLDMSAAERHRMERAGAAAAGVAAAAGFPPSGAPPVTHGPQPQGGPPQTYLGPENFHKYRSTGLAGRTPSAFITKTQREVETRGLRVMSDNKAIPPASGPLRVGAGAEVLYDVDDDKQGHRPRSPSWRLPPNRVALSKQWISSAALAFLN